MKRYREEVLDDLFEDEIDYDYSDIIDDGDDSLADVEELEECFSNFALLDEISQLFINLKII